MLSEREIVEGSFAWLGRRHRLKQDFKAMPLHPKLG